VVTDIKKPHVIIILVKVYLLVLIKLLFIIAKVCNQYYVIQKSKKLKKINNPFGTYFFKSDSFDALILKFFGDITLALI
jgi:hypothetical protein